MGEFHEVSLMLERANKNRLKRESLGLVGTIETDLANTQIVDMKKA